MIDVTLAGICVRFENRFPMLETFCRDYRTTDPPALTVKVTPRDIARERQMQSGDFSDDYLETVCAYRKAAQALVDWDVLVMHASVVEVDGWGYGFLAHSGVGKTTQTKLWLEYFGPRARVINGDKPLISVHRTAEGCRILAHGTPWKGKENMGCAGSVPLKALFFLQRSEVPTVTPADEVQKVDLLFRQLLLPTQPEQMERFLGLADEIVNTIPAYVLGCNMSEESVICAYNAGMEMMK